MDAAVDGVEKTASVPVVDAAPAALAIAAPAPAPLPAPGSKS
jgi:hypothetical protein